MGNGRVMAFENEVSEKSGGVLRRSRMHKTGGKRMTSLPEEMQRESSSRGFVCAPPIVLAVVLVLGLFYFRAGEQGTVVTDLGRKYLPRR
jgi:hypothetical protein